MTSSSLTASLLFIGGALLSSVVSPALACIGNPRLNPDARSHFLNFPDKSVRLASDRLDLNGSMKT